MDSIPDRDHFDCGVPSRFVPIPWQEFREEILSLYKPPMCARTTRSKVAQVLRELEALGPVTTADISAPLVAKFIAARPPGQAPHTLHSLLCCVRAVTRYAEKAGYTRVCPFRLRRLSRWIRLPALQGKRHLTREEITRIRAMMVADVERLSVSPSWALWRARRLYAFFGLITFLGLRKMEALQLEMGDVDLDARTIHIRPHGKALKTVGSEAVLPIPDALAVILRDWFVHRMDAPLGYPIPKECPYLIPTANRKAPWISGSKNGKALDRLRAVAKRAGVEGVTCHMLRHSLATHLEAAGCGPLMLQRILRHSNTQTQRRYLHADLGNMSAAISSIDF